MTYLPILWTYSSISPGMSKLMTFWSSAVTRVTSVKSHLHVRDVQAPGQHRGGRQDGGGARTEVCQGLGSVMSVKSVVRVYLSCRV